jgi:uncharacterized protein (DUF2147 family)
MLSLLGGVLRLYESEPVLLAGTAVAGWLFFVAMLGLARVMVSRAGRGLEYLRESAFPVYILHQPAIVVLGYVVVSSSFGIAAKYVAILAGGCAATLGFYHYVVRRSRVLRVLYGMKRLPAPGSTPGARAAAAAALLLGCCAPAGPAQAASAAPLGLWWAEGGAAQVEIRACRDQLCGRVAWLRSPFGDDGCGLRDENNPAPSNRSRPVLGMDILQGLSAEGDDGEWTGGTIYDPATGNTYSCRMTVHDDDTLSIRGYVGVPLLGRTTKWFRVGSESGRCSR